MRQSLKPSRAGRVFCASVVALASLLAAPLASAYCRTTTCNPEHESCARNETGCVREGAAATWPDAPLPYRFAYGTAEELRVAFRSAADRWSRVECGGRRTSLQFREQRDAPNMDSAFTIAARDQIPGRPASELGVTTLAYGNQSGEVRSARMDLDMAALGATPEVDLELVLVHELGHYVGLAHNHDRRSVMQALYPDVRARGRLSDTQATLDGALVDAGAGGDVPAGDDALSLSVSRALGEEDMLAVCTLYPPPLPEPLPPSCSAAPVPRDTDLGAIACVLAVGSLAWARRARRVSSVECRVRRTGGGVSTVRLTRVRRRRVSPAARGRARHSTP